MNPKYNKAVKKALADSVQYYTTITNKRKRLNSIITKLSLFRPISDFVIDL